MGSVDAEGGGEEHEDGEGYGEGFPDERGIGGGSLLVVWCGGCACSGMGIEERGGGAGGVRLRLVFEGAGV